MEMSSLKVPRWLASQVVNASSLVQSRRRKDTSGTPTHVMLSRREMWIQASPTTHRRDFSEAVSILSRSPRMSAVLSRRVLADLLGEYAGMTQFKLDDRIDAFNKDATHPRRIRENLHHLRELGNLSAHTQKDDQASIVTVDSVEAEWTLDVVERLFEYFIADPAKDAAMRQQVDDKLKTAGRKPIPRLPDDNRG